MNPTLPETVMLPLTEIKPFPDNPRQIPDEAVDKVATSIQKYGYQQPITVDTEYVIIVGHTRYLALKKMGVTEVPVYVSDLPEEKAREYRLVDNRTSELTTWDHDALVLELREFEASLIEEFFPDFEAEITTIESAVSDLTQDEIDEAEDAVNSVKEPDEVLTTEITCPSCYHTFQVRTDSLPNPAATA